MDPTTAFLIAAGSGLMGTRGPGGFGRAGMMGLESMDRARRTAVLEAESRQRELERQSAEQMRALQMRQIEAALRDSEATSAAWQEVGKRFSPQAPSGGGAGPRDPDAPQYFQAPPRQQAFPFTWDEVLAIKAKTRGKIDLTQEFKDSVKTEEVKPGTYRQDVRGNREFIPAFDMGLGMQGGPDGVQPIAGFDQIVANRELAKSRAGAQGAAEMDMVTIVDPRKGSPTEGKQITVPRSEAIALSRVANNFPQAGSPAPVQAPQGAPQPAQAPPQPARPPQAPAASDRARILQDELAGEQARLQELQTSSPQSLKLKYGSAFDPVAALERTQNNIAGLQRELGGSPVRAASPQPAGMSPPISPEQAKIDTERKAEVSLNLNKARVTGQNVATVLDNVRAALPLVRPETTGFVGARLAKVEGSDAFQLRANIEPIKAALGFDQLQLMREFSKTGGALGQVAIPELTALQGRVRNLDPNQQESYLRANLFAIEAHYNKFWEIMRQAWKDQYGIDLKDELPAVYGGDPAMSSNYTDSLIQNYLKGPRK
jgi:hypothetical protein